MNVRDRAAVVTGIAFPVGSLLGVIIGSATAPAASGGGFQDIVYILFWSILGAPMFTAITYALMMTRVDMRRQDRFRAALVFVLGVAVACVVMFMLLIVNARTDQRFWIVVGLILSGATVAWFTRRALRQ